MKAARDERRGRTAGGWRWLLLAVASLLDSCAYPGLKLLTMDVQHEGEVVLTTTFDVPDTSSASAMWDAAGREPFATEVVGANLRPSEADPLQVHLAGAVELEIRHVDAVQTRAALTGLTLIRSAITAADWHLPEAEVRRAREAAGL